MTCRCTSNTLRLFIRGVAQLDISTGPKIPRGIYIASIFGKPRTFHGTHLIQRRCNSTISATSFRSNDNDDASERYANSKLEGQGFKAQVEDGGSKLANSVAEISMESIDAIAAESTSDIDYPVHTLESVTTSEPVVSFKPPRSRKKEAAVNETPSNVAYRRTGFTPNSKSEDPPSNFTIRRTGFSADSGPRRDFRRTAYDSPQQPRPFGKDASREPVDDWVPPKKEPWQIQKAVMKEKFPDGWNPRKRLSPDAMTGIRALHQQMPEKYTTAVLAEHFKVSPEGVRRILKSKWQPSADTQVDREMRWFRRGERVWSRYAELGVKPPRKWRDEGIGRGKPEWKKRKEEPSVMPTLMTSARPEDFEAVNSIDSERPQLITTAR